MPGAKVKEEAPNYRERVIERGMCTAKGSSERGNRREGSAFRRSWANQLDQLRNWKPAFFVKTLGKWGVREAGAQEKDNLQK